MALTDAQRNKVRDIAAKVVTLNAAVGQVNELLRKVLLADDPDLTITAANVDALIAKYTTARANVIAAANALPTIP